jgi:hypothetical protein
MTFKQFLQERLDFGTEAEDLLKQGYLPLLPKLFKDLGYSEDNVTAFHMTNSNNIRNRKKSDQISCFTKPSLELTKLPSRPDIVEKVKGRMLIKGSSDIYTYLDFKGRRWIKLNIDQHKSPAGKQLQFMLRSFAKDGITFDYYRKLDEYMQKDGYKLLNKYLKEITFSYDELILDRVETIGYYTINGIEKNIPYKYLGDLTTREFLKLKP